MTFVDVTEFFSRRGGVRRHLEAKGAVLARTGHRHLVIAPGRAATLEPVAVAGPGSSQVQYLRGPTLPYDHDYQLLWRLDRVRDAVERARPDVLEIHSLYLAALALRWIPRRAAGIRTMFWHSDFIVGYLAAPARRLLGDRGDRALALAWAWVRQVARRVDAVFVTSRYVRDQLAAQRIPGVVQIPFGFDKTIFHPGARDPGWRRELLGARADSLVIAGVGRLSAEKRWPVVLEAFFSVAARRRATLVIFGDGPERPSLERMCAGRDDVRFLGFEPDPRRLARGLASADLFLHGAPFETFGMSVAQALLCGLPAVVPDRGAAPELALPAFGERYRAEDAAACASALERLLARDLRALGQAAAAHTRKLPTPDEQMEATIAVHRELLARRQRS